jgi:catechol 2,3-dioxygenase-like lactoylglutathione lyase family enzyme
MRSSLIDVKFNPLVPEFSVSNLSRSRAFYVDALGFKVEYERPANKFMYLSFQDSQIMIEETNGHWATGVLEHPYGRGINFQFHVENVNDLVESLRAKGIPLFRPLTEAWYRGGDVLIGVSEFLVQDPDGYLLRFAQEIGSKPV